MRRILSNLLILAVLLGIIGAVAYAGQMVSAQHGGAGQAEITAKFGDQVFVLCSKPPTKVGSPSSGSAKKYLIIDTFNKQVYAPYQNALTAEQKATSQADLTVLVCLLPDHQLEETCEYKNTSSIIKRYSNNLTVTQIDFVNKRTLSTRTLEGTLPADCPDPADNFDDIQGTPPLPRDFINFITGTRPATG